MPNPPSPVSEKEPAPDHAGHRKRLKERFLLSGDVFLDYELLELLLCHVIPRTDVKPLAKELLKTFQSLSLVLHASPHRLKKIKGIGDQVVLLFKLVTLLSQRMAKETIVQKQTLATFEEIQTFCIERIGFKEVEHFLVLFLDSKNGLICDEVLQVGTIDSTSIYVRELCKRALEVGASSIIIAHNHPSGDPSPSREDVQLTHHIMRALLPLHVALLDHIVIGHNQCSSLRRLGLLS